MFESVVRSLYFLSLQDYFSPCGLFYFWRIVTSFCWPNSGYQYVTAAAAMSVTTGRSVIVLGPLGTLSKIIAISTCSVFVNLIWFPSLN